MFWQFYNYIAVIAVITQLLVLVQMYRNYRYVLKKAYRKTNYQPPTLLTVPCKGLDNEFEKNITSFFNLEYDNYYINFVVEDTTDPSYEKLSALTQKLAPNSKTLGVQILVAGLASKCSQKTYNLLCSCNNSPDDIEIFAFVDSDACIKPNWLKQLVYPLRHQRNGASTGYRWFVPQQNNLASLVLYSLNAKIAQLLGDTHFNQAWGGSMAIRKDTFYKIGLDKIWQKAISDDLALTYAVKKARMKVVFVPACFVASYEKTTWKKLFEFARRQFVMERVTTPSTWWFAFFCSLYALSGFWATAPIAIIAAAARVQNLALYTAVPLVFFIGQISRAALRQKMIAKLLPDDADKMKPAMLADILGNCIWAWLLFIFIISSAFGRKITWRGITYKLISPTETIVLKKNTKMSNTPFENIFAQRDDVNMMTSKERIIASIKGQPYDRTAVTPIFMAWAGHFIGHIYRDYYLDGDVLVGAQLAVLRAFNLDQISVISDPWREASAYGMTFDYPQQGVGKFKDILIKGPEDVKKLKPLDIPASERMQQRVESVAAMAAEVGHTHSVLGWVEGPLAEYSDLRGLENTMLDLMDKPDMYHHAAEIITQNAIDFAIAQIQAGADMIGIGDAAASLVGAQLYEQYVLPFETRLIDAIHNAGGLAKLHICGNINSIIALMPKTEVDVIDVDWMVPLDQAREKVGLDVTLCGNFDPCAVLLQGTPQIVADAATECIQKAGECFILMPGCEVPQNTPEENIRAFCPTQGCLIESLLSKA